jgi:hypothetical protein
LGFEGGTIDTIADELPGVLHNDNDLDGDSLDASLLTDVSNGAVTFNPAGSFVYIHDGSESPSDSFTYEANDSNGGVDTATVTIRPAGVRIAEGLLVLYSSMEGSDNTMYDVSGVGTPLDLTIQNPANTAWLPGGDFSNWGTYTLGLANEPDPSLGSRPWLGELYLVAIYDNALDQDQVLQNFNAGPTLVPNNPPVAQ